ncbi:MAG: hypothetical protein KGL92_00920, partial [Gammaproteobacteria bacterium]|nr:hypothetical protein [Gammaproteobacteria bacterium]
ASELCHEQKKDGQSTVDNADSCKMSPKVTPAEGERKKAQQGGTDGNQRASKDTTHPSSQPSPLGAI